MKKYILLLSLLLCLLPVAFGQGVNEEAQNALPPLVGFVEGEFVWNDLRFPSTQVRQGASTKPDFDATDLGLLFPSGDPAEIAYIIAQMPHNMRASSDLCPHLHYFQDEAAEPVFRIDYRWYKNGTAPPGSFTTLTFTNFVFTYSSGTLLQIISAPCIDGSAIDTVSSVLDVKLYRNDSLIAGDVLVKEFGFHYQTDSMGSRQEFIK